MRKAALLSAIVLLVSASLTVFAATNALSIEPYLGFNGTTATCEVTVAGDKTTTHIEVAMKLMRGTTCVASWSDAGYGYVYIKEYASVTRGTYDLVIEVAVDGVEKDPVSFRKTY